MINYRSNSIDKGYVKRLRTWDDNKGGWAPLNSWKFREGTRDFWSKKGLILCIHEKIITNQVCRMVAIVLFLARKASSV